MAKSSAPVGWSTPIYAVVIKHSRFNAFSFRLSIVSPDSLSGAYKEKQSIKSIHFSCFLKEDSHSISSFIGMGLAYT